MQNEQFLSYTVIQIMLFSTQVFPTYAAALFFPKPVEIKKGSLINTNTRSS